MIFKNGEIIHVGLPEVTPSDVIVLFSTVVVVEVDVVGVASFNLSDKILKFQWYFFILMFFILSFYLGIIFEWLILGAIINPNNFLVYASSAY